MPSLHIIQEGKRKLLVVHYDRLKPCQDKKTEGVSSCNTSAAATNAREREGYPGRGRDGALGFQAPRVRPQRQTKSPGWLSQYQY